MKIVIIFSLIFLSSCYSWDNPEDSIKNICKQKCGDKFTGYVFIGPKITVCDCKD